MKARLSLALLAGLSVAGLAAISQGQETPRDTSTTRTPTQDPGTGTRTMQPVSEAQVLSAIAVIDSNEINAANLVLQGPVDTGNTGMNGETIGDDARDPTDDDPRDPSNDPANDDTGINETGSSTGTGTGQFEVRDEIEAYARMLLADHQGNLRKTMELAQELDIQVTTTGDLAQRLKQKGKQDLSRLSMLRGAEFEPAYVAAMVKGHQDALRVIDQLMQASSSTNQEIRDHVTSTRSTIAHHLAEARELQQEVSMRR
jgi:putative membrane protein